MFQPRFEILPAAQKNLWPELAEVPGHFVLYGGTALALRLGHRQSVDFDFFSSGPVTPAALLADLPCLRGAKILQQVKQTLTVMVDRDGLVKLSFFGKVGLGRVGLPEETPDGRLRVASLLDLAGTEAAVVTQRSEAKDYLDILAILEVGVSLPTAMAAAAAIYGEQYNPMMTLKSLTYFSDGDLDKLTAMQRAKLIEAASAKVTNLPVMPKLSDELSVSARGAGE